MGRAWMLRAPEPAIDRGTGRAHPRWGRTHKLLDASFVDERRHRYAEDGELAQVLGREPEGSLHHLARVPVRLDELVGLDVRWDARSCHRSRSCANTLVTERSDLLFVHHQSRDWSLTKFAYGRISTLGSIIHIPMT